MKKLLVYIGIVPLFVNSIANMELSNVKIHNVKEARESGLFTEQSDCGTSNLSYVVASTIKLCKLTMKLSITLVLFPIVLFLLKKNYIQY